MNTALIATCAYTLLSSAINNGSIKLPFVPDTNRLVAFWRDGGFLVGRLSSRGEFLELSRSTSGRYSGPYLDFIGQSVRADSMTLVYEFRSDTLVPGRFTDDGWFVPEVGGVIIKFSDYKFGLFSTPIWNLPGRFGGKTREEELREAFGHFNGILHPSRRSSGFPRPQ